MRRLKVLALGVAGVVLPVILVFSAYLIASGSIGAAGSDVPPVPQNRVTSPQETPTSDPSESPSESPSEEPDNSGPGSGDEPDDEDPDNSGPGSSNSGRGSGGGDD